MIISENREPPFKLFEALMKNTDKLLNDEASIKGDEFYLNKNGQALERIVLHALIDVSRGTPFENSIKLVSGRSFPDIVAAKYYGVEVKSTNKDQWKSIGSSILESSRVTGVERIYLTFGKLGKPVAFLSKPYEKCLSEIVVTHYPRYQIDMMLEDGDTVFDRIGIPYEELRLLEDPVKPVAAYYKSKLQKGESLWWTGGNVDTPAPITVKLWHNLTKSEKEKYIAMGYVLCPELLDISDYSKYNRFALWLATSQGIVNNNIRDSFSAGGQKHIYVKSLGQDFKVPAVFERLVLYSKLIKSLLLSIDEEILREFWNVEYISDNRFEQWFNLILTKTESSSLTLKSKVLYQFLYETFVEECE